jgi:TolA-binding protein
MSDAGRELGELKREVVEARNQAIKTDNQIKNLTLDIKGFEKRFDGLDARMRMSSVGVNIIIAATIGIAAYLVSSVRIKGYEQEIAGLNTAVKEEHEAAIKKNEDLSAKLTEVEKKRRAHDQSADVATTIFTLLDNKQEKEAGDLLDKLDLDVLLPFERKVAEKRLGELRQRQGEAMFKAGRNDVMSNRQDQAVPEFRRSLALDPQGRFAAPARAMLASSLWSIRRYDEAEPLLRELAKSDDRGVAEDSKYYLATALARLRKRDEAKTMLTQIVNSAGRYTPGAKAYLAAMETDSELPLDLPGGRFRIARKGPAPVTPAAPAGPVADDATPATR